MVNRPTRSKFVSTLEKRLGRTLSDGETLRLAAYARAIGTKYAPSALIAHVGRVHGLWQNVCALGVSDDALWATMQLAWQVLLAAIAVATRAPERFGLGLERDATRSSASPRPVCNGVSSHPITSS